jgi:hypothetical protein
LLGFIDHYSRFAGLLSIVDSNWSNLNLHAYSDGHRKLQLSRNLVGGLRHDLKLWTLHGASNRPAFWIGHHQGYLYPGFNQVRLG